jgi:PAS domain S-box-containing protein
MPTARILHLEDSDLDAELVRDRLKKSALDVDLDQVANRADFLSALSRRSYDLILSDYEVPGFEGVEALRLALESEPDTPFIFVSGAMGEDIAVESLKLGATDYVIKQRLARLIPAIERALAESQARAQRRATEQDLTQKNELLRLAVQSAKLGEWDLDLASYELKCSETCKANYGKQRTESFRYDELWQMVHPEDRERVQAEVKRAIESHTDYDTEYRTVWPDGTVHWVFVRGRVSYRPDGTPFRMAGFTLDITDRKRNEVQLENLASKLQLINDSVPALISYIDSDLRYQFNNRAYEEWFGCSRAEIHGKHLREVLGEAALARLTPYIQRVLAGERVRFELEVPYRSGEPKYIHAEYVPDFDRQGKVVGYHALINDISDLRRAQVVLRESADRLTFLDQLSEATKNVEDPQTILDSVTQLLGEYLRTSTSTALELTEDAQCYSPRAFWTASGESDDPRAWSEVELSSTTADVLCHTRSLVVPKSEPEKLPPDLKAWLKRHESRALILCPLVRENRVVALLAVFQSEPREWTAGEVSLVEEVAERFWNQLQRVRATLSLKEADRRKDHFLATLAHELRNPLAPLQNGVQILQMLESDNNTVADIYQMFERQIKQMVHLVDDLLDLSRITQGKFQLRKERVDVAELVASSLEMSLPVVENLGHHVQTTLPKEPTWIFADRTRIIQAICNLVSNAAKYTPSGGQIRLIVERTSREAIIRVHDTGIGIQADMLPRVFDMFTQVDRSLERSQGGLGIGLWLVKRIIELHDGSIQAHSSGIGNGSEFVLSLPLLIVPETHSASATPLNGHKMPSSNGVSHRILVVDDNHDAALSLAAILRFEGHSVQTAHDGASALEAAEAFSPRMIFLDLGMPGMNGFEVARRVRLLHGLDRVVLTALTGWGQDEDRRRAQDAGFDHHLVKPAELRTIQKLLAELGP